MGLSEFSFLMCLTFIIIHELDAIREDEWRFFFGWLPTGDTAAYRLFVALHVPLLLFILWNLDAVWLQTGLAIFSVIHLLLHWFLRAYVRFDNWFSWVWIAGSALWGALYLVSMMG